MLEMLQKASIFQPLRFPLYISYHSFWKSENPYRMCIFFDIYQPLVVTENQQLEIGATGTIQNSNLWIKSVCVQETTSSDIKWKQEKKCLECPLETSC